MPTATRTTKTRVLRPNCATKQRVATEYYWPTVYKIIKASSDQAVCRALARFGVELDDQHDLHHR